MMSKCKSILFALTYCCRIYFISLKKNITIESVLLELLQNFETVVRHIRSKIGYWAGSMRIRTWLDLIFVLILYLAIARCTILANIRSDHVHIEHDCNYLFLKQNTQNSCIRMTQIISFTKRVWSSKKRIPQNSLNKIINTVKMSVL